MFSTLHFSLHSFFRVATGLLLLALLAACGSGTTVEPLVPSKFTALGDGATDLGQTGGRYTVNDGTVNTWTERVATSYGGTLTLATSYAQGGARISTGVNSLAAQITTYLGANTPASKEVILVDGGAGELYALAQERVAGTIASDSALSSAAASAGQTMAAQVRRLSVAGGKHIVVSNSYNLSQSPYASANTVTAALSSATRAFNDALKIAIADLGNTVLLVDSENYHSIVYNNGSTYLGTGANVSTAVCTSATVQACTTSTVANTSYNLYMFADNFYFTPAVNRLWGDQVYSKIKNRW